ncbi:MAG TPA: hypothetical protein VK395_21865 [Gemmataceae bacterium]|nr:hypothetical protein [Gemmataceae bacterium]
MRPPGAGNASGFLDILHATLRGAGCRWNAPEWLATGSGADMAAYTASLTAHAPFVRSATQKQNAYKKVFTQVLWEAIEYAIDYGRLPLDTPHLIDIQCEAPSILARDEQDEAQANQIRVTGGWKSRQTVQQEEGLDPEQEMQNIEAYNERFGQGGQGGPSGKAGPVPVHEANFNPNEPRDKRGRWTKDAVGGTSGAEENPNGSTEFFPLGISQVVNAGGDEDGTQKGPQSEHAETKNNPHHPTPELNPVKSPTRDRAPWIGSPKNMEEYYERVEEAFDDALSAQFRYEQLLVAREEKAKVAGEMTMPDRLAASNRLEMRLAKLEAERLARDPSPWLQVWYGIDPEQPSTAEANLKLLISEFRDPTYKMVHGAPQVDSELRYARRLAFDGWAVLRRVQLRKPDDVITKEEFDELQDLIEPGNKGLKTPSQAGDLIDPVELAAELAVGWVFKPPEALPGSLAPKKTSLGTLLRQNMKRVNPANFSKALKGELAEARTALAMRRAGYEELAGRLPGNQGFDGVWIKRGASGTITDIVITESKYSSTGALKLAQTKTMGRQLSTQWIDANIDRLINNSNPTLARVGQLLDANRNLIRPKAAILGPSGLLKFYNP